MDPPAAPVNGIINAPADDDEESSVNDDASMTVWTQLDGSRSHIVWLLKKCHLQVQEFYHIESFELMTFVLDRDLWQSCVRAFGDGHLLVPAGVNFDVDIHHSFVAVTEAGLATPHDVVRSIQEIGENLGRLPQLTKFWFRQTAAPQLCMVASFLRACRQLTEFELWIDDWIVRPFLHPFFDPVPCFEAVRDSLWNHPNLKSFKLVNAILEGSASFDIIGLALPTMSALESVEIVSLNISTPQTANVMRNITLCPHLTSLKLMHVNFGNEEAAAIACNGLAASRLQHFEGYDLTLPDGFHSNLIDSIAGTKTIELGCFAHYLVANFRTLLGALSLRLRHGLDIDSLVLHSVSEKTLVTFLNEAGGSTLKKLKLHVDIWSADLENALTRYIKGNGFLRKLDVIVTDSCGSKGVCSNALLEAIDTEPRCLEHISFQAVEWEEWWSSTQSVHVMWDATWSKQMAFIVALNRQRRLVSPMFAAARELVDEVGRSLQLHAALQAIENVASLMEFMRRNEMGLLSIIRTHRSA
ncbi:hypothetical protein MPSEU_000367400 [Mayamaea pseudoterrestris]|nr:hypothetical protein MPSEU_000367400 [Mayamaea pseudoterrestris]